MKQNLKSMDTIAVSLLSESGEFSTRITMREETRRMLIWGLLELRDLGVVARFSMLLEK